MGTKRQILSTRVKSYRRQKAMISVCILARATMARAG
jgi:hypothetical protein